MTIRAALVVLVVASLSLTGQTFISAKAGMVNYEEGVRAVSPRQLQEGEVFSTPNRSEVLMMPGTFLRLERSAEIRMLATSVTRTDSMWLTTVQRKGNSMQIDGTAASLASLANYITTLKRSGYFEKVEIKETKQDDENTSIQTFWFTLFADIIQPKTAQASAAPAAATAATAAPAKKS